MRIALIACRVLEDEIATHAGAAEIANGRCYHELGLHDRSDELRTQLQRDINALDARDDIDAIVLVYGLCGLGTAGLRAGRHPLVIPRAHDCITLFMGSKEAYTAHQAACPQCYYFSPGWMREERTPGPERLDALRRELSERFDDPEDVEFLVETEQSLWAVRDRVTFLDLGTPEAPVFVEKAREAADRLGWKFEYIVGDPALLRDLLNGPWDDERFQIVPPGETLGHAPDENIFRIAGTGVRSQESE